MLVPRLSNIAAKTVGFCLLAAILVLPGRAWSYNRVCVESKNVSRHQTNIEVGVWVVNDTPLIALVLPLEFRDTDGNGSFTAGSCVFNITPGGRIGTSPLPGPYGVTQTYTGPTVDALCFDGPPPKPLCGAPGRSYKGPASPVDFVSPDGFLWGGFSTNGPPDLWYLPPGNDSVGGVHHGWPVDGESTPYNAGPSFTFLFNVNGIMGTFEIDTMCVCPVNHLAGISFSGGDTLNMVDVPFLFTKGVISIGPCYCPCHGDPQCDSVANVQDVVKTVDAAFRGSAAVADPLCPRERTDVSCDGMTTVVDVVKMVNVAFRGADPAAEFCEPCGM